MTGINQLSIKKVKRMKLSTIILSSIIVLIPLNVLAQNDWSRFPQWVKQRSNPHQFVQIGGDPGYAFLADKKLIPVSNNNYGFIFRKESKNKTTQPSHDYTEIYGLINCVTGDYDVLGRLWADNRGILKWYPQCKGSDCLSPYARDPEPEYVKVIQKNFCPKR